MHTQPHKNHALYGTRLYFQFNVFTTARHCDVPSGILYLSYPSYHLRLGLQGDSSDVTTNNLGYFLIASHPLQPLLFAQPNNLWRILQMGYAVAQLVEALRYKPKVRGSDSRWSHWNFSVTSSFRSHCGPGVDSVSDRNKYQESFLGVKTAGA
jgi:hypothetical protein